MYYLTWGCKMSECKMSPVTYSVSWLLRSRAGRTQSLFSFSLTCTLLPTNSLNTQNNTHTGTELGKGVCRARPRLFSLFFLYENGSLISVIQPHAAVIFSLCCHLALYLGFNLLCFTDFA